MDPMTCTQKYNKFTGFPPFSHCIYNTQRLPLKTLVGSIYFTTHKMINRSIHHEIL